MKKLLKKRVIRALFEIRWTYVSAEFIKTMVNAMTPLKINPRYRYKLNTREVSSFLKFLKKKDIIYIKKLNPSLYQLKEKWFRRKDVERIIGLED